MHTALTQETIPCSDLRSSHGASVAFRGIVRGLEGGLAISGIDYTCYRPLAERQLQALTEEAEAEFGDHGGAITHRLGFVTTGEAAIAIEVTTPRSGAAFELCQWYLRKIKKDVPIWKNPVFIESTETQ